MNFQGRGFFFFLGNWRTDACASAKQNGGETGPPKRKDGATRELKTGKKADELV